MALIELDRTAQPDHPPTAIPPARRYRTAGLLLAVVLLAALGGAAGPDILRWRYLGTIGFPAIPESPFQLDGDRVYAAGGDGPGRTVSAWSLAKPPVKLWTVAFPARLLGQEEVAYGGVRAQRTGDVVLITDGPDTTAVDARTGAVRWHLDIAVHPLPGSRIGLVQDPKFRPGTEYDQDGGAPGQIFFSATGVPHDEAPVETELRGVDLRTGAAVWTARAAGSILTFDHDGVLVLDAGRLTLRSAGTGATLRSTALPRLGGQDPRSARLVGDLMMISYGDPDSPARRLVAYALSTFRPVWQVPETRVVTDPGNCLELICAARPDGLTVLDPATGRPRWHASGLDLFRYGDEVLERSNGSTDSVRLADPATGHERRRLTGWSSDLDLADAAPLVLRRTDESRASEFAVVSDDRPTLKPLGSSRGAVADCAVNDRFVVCRGLGTLQVFSYRS